MKEKWDSDWVHFSKRARRGVIILLLLFTVVAVSPRLYYNYIHTAPKYDVQARPFTAEVEKKASLIEEDLRVSRYNQPDELFDPNDYNKEEWMNIGLSEKQSASILNYLNSGAILKVKTDLKKLYVVDEELYAFLAPKIDLPDTISKPKKDRYLQYGSQTKQEQDQDSLVEQEPKTLDPVSINTASAWDLKRIPGIGPFFATEIIKLREAYGGIISFDQLFDIYNMNEENLEAIKPFLIIDKSEVNKLDINTASEKELRNHPLISYDIAKSIVYFRENHKPYKSIDEVMLSPYIDLSSYKTLEPYIKVE